MEKQDLLFRGLCFQESGYPEALSQDRLQTLLLDEKDPLVILTCKPKADFQLGNLWMLNKVRQLLTVGFVVHIVIIIFDEEANEGSTQHLELQNRANLTKNFILNYLENQPSLTVSISSELKLAEDEIYNNHLAWKRFLADSSINDGSSDKKEIIDALLFKGGKYWASAQHAFVAKCATIYQALSPKLTICGEKHRWTTRAFKAIADSRKLDFPEIIYVEDLKDLSGTTDMDSTRSGSRVLNIRDSEQKILFNLCLTEPNTYSKWIDDAFEKIILARDGFSFSEEQVFTLDEFRQIIPNSEHFDYGIFLCELQKAIRKAETFLCPHIEFNVRWDLKIVWTSPDLKVAAEKIIKAACYDYDPGEVFVRKEFGDGFSQSRVFEIAIFDDDGRKVNFSIVLKIGPASELTREKLNYVKYVAKSRTIAFVEAIKLTEEIDGQVGLAYADANWWIGNNPDGKQLQMLEDICLEDFSSKIPRSADIVESLVCDHLARNFYNFGEFYELRPYREFYETKLVPSLTITLTRVMQTDSEVVSNVPMPSIDEQIERRNLEIRWVKQNVARMSAANGSFELQVFIDKRDDYECLQSFYSSGIRVNVTGKVRDSRPHFLQKKVKKYFDVDEHSNCKIGNLRLRSPEQVLDELLNYNYKVARKSVIHGDLNLRNILVLDKMAVVIDYQYTTPNQLTAFDFVKLELDYRIRILTKNFSIEGLINLERNLLLGKQPDLSGPSAVAYDFICRLRSLAERYLQSPNSSTYEFEDYYYGLYFYGLGMLKFQSLKDIEIKFAIATAAIYQDISKAKQAFGA